MAYCTSDFGLGNSPSKAYVEQQQLSGINLASNNPDFNLGTTTDINNVNNIAADIGYFHDKLISSVGIPKKYFGNGEETTEEDVIIIKARKDRKHLKPVILEVDQILGLPEGMVDDEDRKGITYMDGSNGTISIGTGTGSISIGLNANKGLNGNSIAIGSTATNYPNGIGLGSDGHATWNLHDGATWHQPIIPHNGVKYNDKICIDEDKCLILKSNK